MTVGNNPMKTEVVLQSDGYLRLGFVVKTNEGAETAVAEPMHQEACAVAAGVRRTLAFSANRSSCPPQLPSSNECILETTTTSDSKVSRRISTSGLKSNMIGSRRRGFSRFWLLNSVTGG
jgi:hypothetical protein